MEVSCPLPGYRNPVAAILAVVVVVKVPARYGETVSVDDRFSTPWAIGVRVRVAWNISDVDVVQTNLLRDFMMLQKQLVGSVGKVQQLVVRMEARELQRYVRSEVVVEPTAELPRFVQVLAYLGYDQVSKLRVDSLTLQLQKGLLYGLGADSHGLPPLEHLLPTALVVHDDGIYEALDRPYRLLGSVSVGNEDRVLPLAVRFPGRVYHVFDKDGRLVVAEAHP